MKHFTRAEWDEIIKSDPVLTFIETVNQSAFAKPYWHEDFRRAFYDAVNEEHGKYAIATYGEGEEIHIGGTKPISP